MVQATTLFLCLSFLVASVLALSATAAKRVTDEEMYQQMDAFVKAHQNIPADKQLVEQILTSAKWLELVAQYGSPERKKGVHK